MSSEKSTLDGLRIDRRGPAYGSQRPPWLVPAMLGIVAVGLLIFWWLNRPRPMQVQTVAARTQSGTPGASSSKTLLNASGYVTARRAATVSSKVTGKVIQIGVEEGMKVQEGQVLARLDGSNV